MKKNITIERIKIRNRTRFSGLVESINTNNISDDAKSITPVNKIENLSGNIKKDIISVYKLGSNGRLGNQLFQIASAMGIARKNKSELLLPLWYCNYTKKNMSDFFENKLPQSSKLSDKIPIYTEKNYNYDKDIPKSGSYFLKGYYQNERYFSDIEDEILFYFKPSKNVEEKLYKKYGEFLEKETCSVHIRRGDYVNHPIHGVCDIKYYTKGINIIKEKNPNTLFFIFSDDINWCKSNIKTENSLFIEGNNDVEDLFLISFCGSHIISNSSFSWWGSWLSKNKEKTIIAPNSWFTPSARMDQRGIYTKKMIRI